MKAGGMIRLLCLIAFMGGLLNRTSADEARRIITCAPNITEIVFEMGLGDSVAGVTEFCRFPSEAMRREKVGGYLNPNIEKIVALRTDLVIIPLTKSGLRRKLEGMNLRVLELPNESIKDSLNAMTLIGEKAGAAEKGAALRRRVELEIAAARELYSGRPPVRTLIVVGRSPDSLKDMYAAAPGTFLDELLTAAGGVNVLNRQPLLYPRLSRESLIAMNPEAIIETGYLGTEMTTGTLKASLKAWESLPTLTAVREGRVHTVNDPRLTIQGPAMARSIRLLGDILHPEAVVKEP